MLPLTERRPKHLLEVGGVPFLEHQITKLAARRDRARGAGHLLPRRPVHAGARAKASGSALRLTYVTEEVPLGTAGAIRNVAAALDDDPDHPVVILNGDVLSGHDLAAQLARLRARRGAGLPSMSRCTSSR